LFEVWEAIVVEMNDLAVKPCALELEIANRLDEARQSLTQFDAAARVETNVVAVLPCEQAPAVVLDLVQPICAARAACRRRASRS
jgi:hypothetical protein